MRSPARPSWCSPSRRTARESDGLVATVGHLVARPGASNVIPGDVTLTVDVRHAQDSERRRALEAIRLRAREIAAARGLTVELDTGTGTDTVEMDSATCAPRSRAPFVTAASACASLRAAPAMTPP